MLWIFQNLMKIQFCWRLIFEILIIHKPSLGSCNVPYTIWARSVQLLWRLLQIQTDKKSFYLEVFNSILSNHINFIRRVLFIWQILPHIVVCVLYSFLLQDKSQPGTWNVRYSLLQQVQSQSGTLNILYSIAPAGPKSVRYLKYTIKLAPAG